MDSLLQVHALHNLLDILPFVKNNEHFIEQHKEYEIQLERLQAKYLNNCSSLVDIFYFHKIICNNIACSVVARLKKLENNKHFLNNQYNH